MKYISSLLLLMLSLIVSCASVAADFEYTASLSKDNLHDIGRMYQARPMQGFPESFDEIAEWETEQVVQEDRALFSGRYFLVTKVTNKSPYEKLVLYPYNTVVSTIETRVYSKSQVDEYFSGGKAINEFPFHYGNTISLPPNEEHYIITLFESEYFYTPIKLSLVPVDEFKRQSVLENTIMILCFGVGVVLGLYSVLIYIGSKDITHLYYAAFAVVWVFAWSHFFHIPDQFFGVFSANLHWLGFALAPLANTMFCVHLLKLKETHPKFCTVMIWVGIIAALGAPFCVLFPGFGFLWATITTGTALTLGLYIGVKRTLEGFKPARYFVMAYLCMAFPNMIGNFTNLGLLPSSSVNLYLLGLIGTALDALLLAFAVADKFRLTNEENVELTRNLEAKVLKRTYELEQLASELRDASEAKSRFLANMSHEIRTPMTSIIGYADGIMLGDIKPHERNHAISVILQNSRHVLGLINDILDMSKIEANRLEVELVESPLFQTIAHVQSLLGKQIRDKGLEFELNYHFPLPDYVLVDPTRLRQILLNLTSNALKFTTVGKISIDVSCNETSLIIKVHDTGIGMTTEEQKELFSAFYQADSSTSRKYGGTGLGLNISKSLAHKLDGDITVKSEVGSGTEFTLTIGLYSTERTRWVENMNDVIQSREEPPMADEFTNDLKGEVLLAEDHIDNSKLITRILERMGLSVTTVENGQQAVQAVLDKEFDLILMDIQMPVMDGEQALNFIQATGFNGPVIALTANTMHHEIERYIKLGFADHLSKPIDRRRFASTISHYLNLKIETDVDLPEDEFSTLKKQYLSGLNEQRVQLTSLAKYEDFEGLGKKVHEIKGTAGMFECTEIHQYAKELDTALKNNDISELPELLNHLLNSIDAVITEASKQSQKHSQDTV